ncbi:P-loop NTPase fold protein [Akkermansia sp. 54_46]|uniref:P-loop NTPase fold protein n=1 Tax=Akkermansia sp. 54_46 TaxID=1896967 RepID=UPI00095B73A6|nr:P-loop NTPase fold protein [Akkermansia sp. 54_46]OLA87889.1 MAG: hypothetical protein BHW66_12890 [Akkermansia sp. 54_46]
MSDQSNFPNNTHIESFLDYYTALTAPHYAVLLTGKWGIGKTFFITRYMEKIFPKQEDESEKIPKIIKISLNGVQTKDEIDDMIIKEFHPFMNKKSARLTGKIFSSLLKSQGIDLDNLKTDDFFNIYHPESIYIFDDLERCCMPIEASLGYINSFVENNNCKVIIIGNEEEIAPYADNQKKASYKSIKEKVIGKTLRMMPETENALNYFLDQLQKGEGRKFLKSQRDLIIQMYQTSKLDNLRILQQSLNDFERLYAYLEDKHKKHEMFMKDLVMLFFILSFEIKAGHFSCHDLEEWQQDILRNSMGGLFSTSNDPEKDNDKNQNKKDYLSKYGEYFVNIIAYRNIFSELMLSHILEDGFFPEDDIKQELDDLPVYFPSKEPWRNLWHWRDQKSEELDSMLEQFEQDFKERKYSDIGVILHVFGLRLFFSKNGLLTQGTAEIGKECRQYVDEIVSSLSEENFDFETSRLTGMYGLGFYKSDSEEWLELKDYLKDKFLDKINDRFRKSLRDQLLYKQELTGDQINKLNNTNFQNISILELCGVSFICNYLKDASYDNGLGLLYIITNRFYREGTDTKSREWECLQSIRENLDTIQKRASRWDKLKIQNYIQYIDNEASKKIGPPSVTKRCSEEESAPSPSHSVEKS